MSTKHHPKKPIVHAGGAVLWRPGADGPEVALVHRPRYDDWSLPKGHIEPDEHPVVGGLREVIEETGFGARFVRAIDRISYDVPRRPRHGGSGEVARKRVTYWSALAESGEFVANEETDRLRWATVPQGVKLLTYSMDKRVLRKFGKQPPSTATMLIVRHAKAGRKQDFQGEDSSRPLDRLGRAQAEALAALCGVFAPGELMSAPPVRCQQTLAPLAQDLDLTVAVEPVVSEENYSRDPSAAHHRIREIAAAGERSNRVPVVSSQGGVIPDLMTWWAKSDRVTLPPARNRKASVWVVTTAGGRLLTADHIDTPLPLGHRGT